MTIAGDARKKVTGFAQGLMAKAVALAPDSLIPLSQPDPLISRKHGQIGRSLSRVDGPLKVKGAAKFASEIAPENMVYAAVAFSTIAKGRITAFDLGEARGAPGVVLVMTHENAPPMKPVPQFLSSTEALGGNDLPVMQDNCVHWNGQPIALVLAETQEQADHAKSLIKVSYVEEQSVTRFAEAKAGPKDIGMVHGLPQFGSVGDAEAALAAAPHKVDLTYTTPIHNHSAIELHAATVYWEGECLRVHDASQGVSYAAWSLAKVFETDLENIHVTSPFVGGGFGSKMLWAHQILAAAASKLSGRPVRLVLSREGVHRAIGFRSPTEQRVVIGAEADGRFTAIIHKGFTPQSPHNNFAESFILSTRNVYAADTFDLRCDVGYVDMVANTFMRAPGEAVGTFAVESAVDELAHQLGMDPIELRKRNEPDREPFQGTPFSSRNIVEAYQMGAERFGWNERRGPGERREGEWLVGLGCATGTYPYYREAGGAARVTVRKNSTVTVSTAAHEMGMGTATAQLQVAADRFGLPLESVSVEYGDSTLPGYMLAGGSQQMASMGMAMIYAQRKLNAELIKLAGNDSPLAGLGPEEVEARDGGLCAIADPPRFESYASILERAQRDEVSAEVDSPASTEIQHWAMISHGAMFCEVRVNAVTGEVRIARFLGSMDCGRILNPKTAASQFRGGIIMGLGMAIMEQVEFDERNGRIMNPSMAEYHVPVHADVPPIELLWTDIPDMHAPMGARGVGEIGITGTGAAVANAIFNATGKRIRDLPITLDKLM